MYATAKDVSPNEGGGCRFGLWRLLLLSLLARELLVSIIRWRRGRALRRTSLEGR
jgi:hypothetical protein